MKKARKKQLKGLPQRRSFRKFHKASWGLYVRLNGDEEFCKRIFFRAFGEKSAKAKALPKLQGFLTQLQSEEGNVINVWALLKCVSLNGNGYHPVYVLRQRYLYFRSIVSTRYPARVFKRAVGGFALSNSPR